MPITGPKRLLWGVNPTILDNNLTLLHFADIKYYFLEPITESIKKRLTIIK